MVRGFKISVIKQIKLLFEKGELQFAPTDIWQRNYYEHIIRNEIAYFQITEYIQNNPSKWEEDRFYIL
ncbi:hypothetical protein V6W75_09580 [Mannheimia sp. HC-2023]|uniref:Uncharacterized protein n=1 Tax=Mannheimia indoligenes TaxID=3103145 RepID=A0ABU7ZE40_9PAST